MPNLIDPRPLGVTPRRIAFVSTTDGNEYEFLDDGGAVTPDGFFPGPHRQQLERNLRKFHEGPGKKHKLHERMPVYLLKERVPGIRPDDPLLDHPCLADNPALTDLVEKGAGARREFLRQHSDAIAALSKNDAPKAGPKKTAPKGATGYMAARGDS